MYRFVKFAHVKTLPSDIREQVYHINEVAVTKNAEPYQAYWLSRLLSRVHVSDVDFRLYVRVPLEFWEEDGRYAENWAALVVPFSTYATAHDANILYKTKTKDGDTVVIRVGSPVSWHDAFGDAPHRLPRSSRKQLGKILTRGVYARAREDYEGFLHLSDMLGIGPEGVLHDIESSDTHEEDSNSDGELSAEEEEVEEPIADNVVTVEFEEGSLEDGYFATQSYLSPVDILTLTASVAFPEPVPQQTVATLTPTVVTEAAEVTPYETIAQIAPNISIDIDVPTIADIVNQTLTTTFGVSGTDVPKLQYTGSRFTINARVAVGIVIKACYEATGLNIAFHNLDLFK